MTKKQKLITIISSLCCLLACVITLGFYFAFKPIKKSDIIPIAIEDVTISKGERAEINYRLLYSDAKVEFSVTNISIAKVFDFEYIEGVGAGITFLNAKVIMNNSTYSAVAQVRVIQTGEDNKEDNNEDDNYQPEEENLYYKILPLSNCSYSQPALTLTSSIASFSVNISSDKNFENLLSFNQVEIQADNGIEIEIELNVFIITACNNGVFYLRFPNLNYSIYIEVSI